MQNHIPNYLCKLFWFQFPTDQLSVANVVYSLRNQKLDTKFTFNGTIRSINLNRENNIYSIMGNYYNALLVVNDKLKSWITVNDKVAAQALGI